MKNILSTIIVFWFALGYGMILNENEHDLGIRLISFLCAWLIMAYAVSKGIEIYKDIKRK